MPKFGAISTLTPSCSRSHPRTVSSRSSSNPVVPTTACSPCEMHQWRLSMTTSGWVKSTTTSAAVSASRGSSLSTAATSSMSSAASTALQTSTPTRPRAPSTPTRITSPKRNRSHRGPSRRGRGGGRARAAPSGDVVGEVPAGVRADHREGERPVEHLARHRRDVLGGHRVDAAEHLVDRHEPVVDQLALADAGHARAGVLQAEHETAAHLALAADDLLLGEALGDHPGELVAADLQHLVDLRRQAAHVDAELAGVGVLGGVA